jgi:hypothetical protein
MVVRDTVIPAKAGIQRRPLQSSYRIEQIVPVRIVSFNQFLFPLPVPFLDLLFARNGGGHVIKDLVVHQTMHLVFLGKTVNDVVPVLEDALDKVAGYADV